MKILVDREGLKVTAQEIENLDRGMFFRLEGYLGCDNYFALQKEITRIIDDGYCRLVFDMERVPSVSSCFIFWAEYIKKVSSMGGGIVSLKVDQRVYYVVKLLGFGEWFRTKNTLEEAIAYFSLLEQKPPLSEGFPVPHL